MRARLSSSAAMWRGGARARGQYRDDNAVVVISHVVVHVRGVMAPGARPIRNGEPVTGDATLAR